MKKYFLVTLEVPDWADNNEGMERVREEIEQHAVASVAFFTRATHVQVNCEALATPSLDFPSWTTKPK